jgi:hypothetical protein
MPKLPRLRKKDATPRKQVTGTTYTAQGSVPPPPVNYNELGSRTGGNIVDPVPELGNPQQAAQTYRKMVRTDVSVRTSLRAGKAPVLGGEFYIEPFDADEENQAIAEFVNFNIFEATSTPWVKTLEQILKMYEDGCSVFETVWELREWAPKKTAAGANRRQYTMLRGLTVRPRDTVKSFTYDDNGGPVEIVHNKIDAKGRATEVKIPIGKAVVFTFDQEGGKLDGNSILRSAYEHWFYKYHLYKIDGIQKERHGIGVPEIELQPGYTANDVKIAHELGSNLRTNERAYIVRTTMMKIGFAKIDTQPVDALKSALHHDNMIMKNVMVQFLNLGVDQTGGGRATGATSMDMMLKSMRFVAQSVCDAINLYLIPNLVAYNFPTDKFPKLQVRGIGESKDLQMWSAAMRNLIDVGGITLDEPTEQWIRKQVDMPKKLEPRPDLIVLPAGIKEILQGALPGTTPSATPGGVEITGGKGAVATPTPSGVTGGSNGTGTVGRSSRSGGAGNVGKSPSSGE